MAATYQDDLAFLRDNTEIVELSAGEARLAVAPAFQGRAMTSTLAADAGSSFGWLNRPFIAAGAEDPVFNNYGGEDRFWLGPEAGQFGLWFTEGEPFDLDHWKTQPGLHAPAYEVAQRSDSSVTMKVRFDVTNYSGARFDCRLERTISLIDAGAALGVDVPQGIRSVAFQSANVLTNAGPAAWQPDTGLVSIWILGMMKGLANGKVIAPYLPGSESELGPKACVDYFGQIPADRCRIIDDCVWFKVDGLYRSKIGLSPARARNVFGSYDPLLPALTIVKYDLPPDAARRPYVNSMWELQDDPYAGDAVNSYNDSGTDAGEPTFYELESSGPALALAPGQSATHTHRTCHLTGEAEALALMARQLLGVTLGEIF